ATSAIAKPLGSAIDPTQSQTSPIVARSVARLLVKSQDKRIDGLTVAPGVRLLQPGDSERRDVASGWSGSRTPTTTERTVTRSQLLLAFEFTSLTRGRHTLS